MYINTYEICGIHNITSLGFVPSRNNSICVADLQHKSDVLVSYLLYMNATPNLGLSVLLL